MRVLVACLQIHTSMKGKNKLQLKMSSKYIGGGIRICHWFINSFTTPWYFGNYPSSEVSLVTEGGNSTDWF